MLRYLMRHAPRNDTSHSSHTPTLSPPSRPTQPSIKSRVPNGGEITPGAAKTRRLDSFKSGIASDDVAHRQGNAPLQRGEGCLLLVPPHTPFVPEVLNSPPLVTHNLIGLDARRPGR